jgi:peptidoglycan/xylan/chitin deacetylase (PgdA/CDA1 family)
MTEPWYWWVRRRLPRGARARVRRAVDLTWRARAGSVVGAATPTPTVGLTFDDGPDPEVTERLLNTLRDQDIRATFFFLAGHAEALPDLARRVVAEGHEVGLHGADHRRLTTLAPRAVAAHIRDGRDRLAAVTGSQPVWFRPPFGAQSLRTYVAARRAGLDVVVWSADGADWLDDPAEEIAARAQRVEAGGILLLHERAGPEPGERQVSLRFDPVEVADRVVEGLRRRGLEPVPVGELVAGGARRTVWFRP